MRRRGGCKTKKEELGPDCKGLALSIVLRSLDSNVEKMKNQKKRKTRGYFYAHPYLDRIL